MTLDSSFWSAVAAVLAAFSAAVTAKINNRSLNESLLPELILEDWSRNPIRQPDTLSFAQIRNVGRGPAFRVMVNCPPPDDRHPQASLPIIWLPVIAPGEAVKISGDITIYWENTDDVVDSTKRIQAAVVASCSDRTERRHIVEYSLLIAPLSASDYMANSLVEGVLMTGRATNSRPKWLANLVQLIIASPIGGRLPRVRS